MRVQQAMPPVLHLRRNDLHNTITIIGEVFSRHLEFWFKLINLVLNLLVNLGPKVTQPPLFLWGWGCVHIGAYVRSPRKNRDDGRTQGRSKLLPNSPPARTLPDF